MNNLDKQYLELITDILNNGSIKENRTGVNTISLFGRQIRHDMSTGFPILTTKKIAWEKIITELLWFLRGESNIQSLVKDNNYIWVGDAYKNYKNNVINKTPMSNYDILGKEDFIDMIKNNDEFANVWGEMGPIYGKQWRNWGSNNENIDQIKNLINDLIENPDSRRLMLSAWSVSELNDMVLPPCHYGFQLYTTKLSHKERISLFNRNNNFNSEESITEEQMNVMNIPSRKISLMWNQRSVDVPLGLPFNISSYGLLLEIIGKIVNMVPYELVGNLGDTHIYVNQIENLHKQLSNNSYELPKLDFDNTFFNVLNGVNTNFSLFNSKMFKLINYICCERINFKLSN